MIQPDINALRLILANNKDDLRFWASLALDGAKICGIAGAALGLFMLLAYLRSSNAPLPIADVSASLSFIIIVAVYASIATILCAVLFAPAIMCGIPPKNRRRLRLSQINYGLNSRQILEKLGSQYLLFQGGALGAIAMTSILLTSTLSEWTILGLLVCAVVGGGLVSFGRFYSRVKLAKRIDDASIKIKIAFEVFLGSIARGTWCLVWLLVIVSFTQALNISPKLVTITPKIAYILFSLAFFVTTSVLYCALTSVRVLSGRIPLIVVSVALVTVIFNPSYCGARSLYFLGLGGGIPVNILTRTIDSGQSAIVAKNIEGCLIINMGGRIVMRPLLNPDIKTCSHPPSNSMLAGVIVMSQADILTISGFEGAKPHESPHFH